ncbi:hypothetical protein O2N63_09675 [Aliiroseovarius sp. KMU-50]|uniref:Uncharacterized protein n=1 Tax=Aliiroseovarius salicola TaxID=3009082 RepID=A0ABT4W1Q0_9RHOB|nr:hypothetical protein [Aliiroseovarius sp. KMU-50]MDA5094354.1 hypothetical protein [Aliiroseovarius sp. KMU-50]
MKLTGLAFFVATFLAPAAVSAAEYECTLKMKKSGGNWMGPEIYIDYDEAKGEATVIDEVINHYNDGKRLTTTSITDNDKRVTFRYLLKLVGGSSTTIVGVAYANQKYSLTILKPSMKAIITMKPIGYSNSWRDEGACIKK